MSTPGRRAVAALHVAILALGLLAATPAAQLAVQVDPPSGEVGLRMTVSVSVEGEQGADCSLVETPAVDGARLELAQGPVTSSSTSIINGRVSRSLRTEWSFVLVPERAGTLEVPPIRFTCRGEQTATRAVSVPVSESTRAEDIVDLLVEANTDQLWAGQTFNVTVRASIDEAATKMLLNNGLELDLPWLAGLPGMIRLDTPPPVGQDVRDLPLAGRGGAISMRAERSLKGPRPRIVFTRQIDLLATEPGTLQFPESRFSAVIATEVQQDRSFDLFSSGRLVATRTASADARAPGPMLVVRAPPEAGRPASFTNAVGRFKLSATAAPDTLAVGETCLLSLVLTGLGNLEFVRWPAFDALSSDFRIFGKNERKLAGARVLELELSPKNERVTRIPPLELAAFDPEAGSYQVLTVGPFDLTVTPGGNTGLANLETPAEVLSSFETIREELPPPQDGWPAWLPIVPAALALVCAEGVRRRAAWRDSHGTLLRRRAAMGRLEQALAEARDGRDLAVAFGKFLSDRLDGPPAGLTADEAAQRLSDAGLAAELRATVGRWEAAYLGGGTLELDRARGEARELAARLEAAT